MDLKWKWLLILVVVGVAGWFTYPPDERINLGLDLKGGAHIVLQVDMPSSIKYELETIQSRVGQRLQEDGIAYTSVDVDLPMSISINGTPADKRDAVKEIVDLYLPDFNVTESGGSFRGSMSEERRQFVQTTAMASTLEVLRKRIDSFGVAEPLIQQQSIDRILLQLPGVEDPDRVKDILLEQAVLEWKEVTFPPNGLVPLGSRQDVLNAFGGQLPADTEILTEDRNGTLVYWPLKKVSVVRGSDLRNAVRSVGEFNDPVVAFELTQEAGRRFEAATSRNLKKPMAIVLGNERTGKNVLSAPTIDSTIRDQGRITGRYTIQEADDFALKLRSGAIPVQLDIIEERQVGASLGADSIRRGLTAGLAGFLGVMIFMLIYYRLSGVNAVVALALNVVLVFGILGMLPVLADGVRATLTLPGIAGMILTVGMAVDSNVLIFERIREELRLGKTVRSAIDQGFARAFTTILDCNITTLVAAFFLFAYGTGPVQGFAVTLTIGLLASMFTAVFVSRQIFALILGNRQPDSLSI
ncbi:hypothetical protein ABI59_01270 [Acidobacteria bacterium Mor1]|nr:hypothetical protein ABI59_01270 [Acidobacteria bacterium Mor1]